MISIIKNILFKFILRVWSIKDFTTLFTFRFQNSKDVRIHYIFNNKHYIFIGKQSEFPPTIAKGFFLPIKEVIADGEDVTSHVKRCSGPKNDFYGKDPDISLVLGKLAKVPTVEFTKLVPRFSWLISESKAKCMRVTNILNQTRELGKT
jgi:hypothetical protein